jgi:hypothetical protein
MNWLLGLLPIAGSAFNLMRLPALMAFFVALFGALFSWFLKWFSHKMAYQMVVITSVVGLTMTLIVAIKALLFGILLVAPDNFVQACSWFVPDNSVLCLSAIVSAKAIRWVWVWQIHFIMKAVGTS